MSKREINGNKEKLRVVVLYPKKSAEIDKSPVLSQEERDIQKIYFSASSKGIVSYVVEGFRSQFLISSGGTAALLTFIGYLARDGLHGKVRYFLCPFSWFFIASIANSVSCVMGYFAQRQYTMRAFHSKQNDNKPMNLCHVICLALFISAYIFCAIATILTGMAFYYFDTL
jgi:hypothetical protein